MAENDSNRRRRESDCATKESKSEAIRTESSMNTEISIPAEDDSETLPITRNQSLEVAVNAGNKSHRMAFEQVIDGREILISRIKQAISSEDAESQLEGCQLILNASTTASTPSAADDGGFLPAPVALYCLFDSVVEANLVSKLVDFLGKYDQPELQESAAWILATVAKYQGKLLVSEMAIEPLVNLLRSTHPKISRPACYALSGLTGCGLAINEKSDIFNKYYVDKLVKAGIIPRTKELASEVLMEARVNVPHLMGIATLIKSLCYVPKNIKISRDMLNFLGTILHIILAADDTDFALLDQVTWALYYLTKSGKENIIEEVVGHGVLTKMISKLEPENTRSNVIVPCVKVLGNIVSSSTDTHTERVLNEGILDHLGNLMNTREFATEANWIVGNIAAGTIAQKNRIFESGLLQMTLDVLKSEVPATVKIEALHTILNFIEGGSGDHRRYLIDQGLFQLFVNLLREYPEELARLVVDCTHSMLEIFQAVGDNERDDIIKTYEESGILLEISKFQFDFDEAITDRVAIILDVALRNDWG